MLFKCNNKYFTASDGVSIKTALFRCLLLLLVIVSTVSCSQYKVYSVKEDNLGFLSGGVFYALPKTELRVAVTVQHRSVSDAPYSAFAAELLGIDAYGTDTSYRIASIDVQAVDCADPDNYYFVMIRRGSVTVDKRHLLLAVGMANPETNVATVIPADDFMEPEVTRPLRAQYNLYDRADTFYTRNDRPGHPTKVSMRKDVRNIRQQAEAAAEQLEEIRERRNQILNGDYDGNYSHEVIQFLLSQLQREEESIVNLFCGSVCRETVVFYVDPVIKKKDAFVDTIAWISPKMGLWDDDTAVLPEDAFPIVCTVQGDNQLRAARRFVNKPSSNRSAKNRMKFSRKTFRYRVPEQASVVVSCPDFAVSRRLLIAQLGPTVQLPHHRIKALFDANTLDLIYFNRDRH